MSLIWYQDLRVPHLGWIMLDTISSTPATALTIVRENPVAKYASWCLVFLFLLACVGPRGANTASGAAGDGDTLRQLGYIAAAAATLYVCRGARWLHLLPLSAMLALGWCWLSLVWAIDPSNGFRRLVLTSMLTVSIFAAVDVAGVERSIRAFTWLGIAILLLNLFYVFGTSSGVHRFGESLGDPSLAGNWRGAMGHKNYAGPYTAVTLLMLLLGPRLLPTWAHWPIIGLGAIFLWGTQSMTSIGLFLICLFAAVLFGVISARGRRLLLPTLLLIIVTALLLFWPEIYGAFESFGEYLRKPEAVTGRGEIWLALGQFISENWLLGSGYGSLWGIGPDGPIQRLVSSWVEDVYSGHNGYLDMLGMVGVPGLLFCIFGFFIVPLVRLTTSSKIPPATGALLLSIVLFSLGHNFTESTLLTRDLVMWLMHAMALAMIYKLSRVQAESKAGP